MSWRLAAGWVLAVVLTTAVAWQIVAVADERVGDRPVSPVQAAPTTTSITTELSGATGPTPPPEPTLPPAAGDPTTTTSTAPETSSTTGDDSAASTSAPSTSSPSTTSPSSARWSTKTIATNGGTLVVSYRPGEVILETAVPRPGFQTEIDKTGPPVVEVEFESSSLRVDITAEWDGDELEIEVDEEPSEN